LLILTESAQDAARLRDELAWFAPELAVSLFPDWETLPYDPISPHPDLISERLAALWLASEKKVDVLVAPAATAMQRLAPRAFLAAHAFLFRQGEKLDVDAFRARLADAGYSHVNQVLTPGEFAVRGGLIDLFPMGAALPYRLELFDDDIDSIRTFDPDSQRTLYKVNDVRLLPAREFPLDETGITRFRQGFRDSFEGDPSRSKMYKDVSNKLAPAGIEYYLPLFFDTLATLFDYLPDDTRLILHGEVQNAVEGFWRDTQSRHRLLAGDKDRPLLPPGELFLMPDQFFGRVRPYARLEMVAKDGEAALPFAVPPSVEVDRRAEQPFARLQTHLDGQKGMTTLLVAETLGRRETMANALAEHGLKPALTEGWPALTGGEAGFLLTTGPLAAGFVAADAGLTVLTETELYARTPSSRAARAGKQTQVEGLLRDLSELKINDPVVHVQHGIGRYLGLTGMDLGDGTEEFLTLEFAGGDKLYVPVAHLHLISRYMGGDPDGVPLHKLGSGQWEKAKRRAMEKARDTAAELLNLYARRAARKGTAFSIDGHGLDAFASGFEFEETPDQLAAINAVADDMRAGRPMDRLVCGDVGFGKTEVALRAAYIAVADGKQVAVLCPTTLLVEQHFQTFSDRFADFPVKLAELSRFRSTKEVKATAEGLKTGAIDIVIGTHKLIQPDVKFKNLGLVIIDDEHRFGVRQKEQLKALRAEVDVLTLTATPIPRTLAMSLEGIRDFSVIATAPQKRLAIKTFVQPWSEGLIREAVLRELKRGGQVYFLHNEVESIVAMGDKLEKLLPEARIQIAHGQMPERELEHVMRDFYHHRFNMLLCTTIIETGINVPTANTILINRADRFGLAQLHQLRGRVGRSHHQAYAYLLTPPGEASITAAAGKRLEAIQMMEELGSGFYLAMHDLEIRGAGEVLGESQSGEMQEVGFNLFNEMLLSAVKSLKDGKEPDLIAPLAVTTEINLHLPALLPEDYCDDVHERLVLYKRLANCSTCEELQALEEELIDRFGLPPEPARVLIETHRLRLDTQNMGIQKLDAGDKAVSIQFEPNPPIDPARLIKLIQSRREYKLAGQDKLRIETESSGLEARLALVRASLAEITGS
jgi:transcription-repair coupling factor (superfamily II helicase)